MNLIIDQGNSYTKIFLFDKNKVEFLRIIETARFDIQRLSNLITEYQVKKGIISSVAVSFPFAELCRLNPELQLIKFDHTTPIPVINAYQTPQTLGLDRLAGVIGAHNIFPGSNVLVIDAGTAVTFDLINSEAQFLGGNISPGLDTRFRALHQFTGKLPLVEKSGIFSLVGKSTEEAIRNGVQNGLLFEIDGYIDRLRAEYFDCKVILTGGDAIFFEKKLKNTIFAEPNLVAIGLNRILNYNEQSI
jgi:type III pantothenate kinase